MLGRDHEGRRDAPQRLGLACHCHRPQEEASALRKSPVPKGITAAESPPPPNAFTANRLSSLP